MKWWKLVVSFIKKIWVAICKFMNTETLITFPEQTPADPFSEFDLLRGTAYIEYIAGMGVCIAIHAGGRIAYIPDSPSNRSLVLGYMPIYEKYPIYDEKSGDGLRQIDPTDEEIEIRKKKKKKYPSLKYK